MITDAILDVFDWIVASVVGLLPELSPDQMSGLYAVPGQIGQIATSVGKLAPIIPFGEIALALALFIGLCLVAATFQTVRIVGSFVTLGGGGV